MCVGCVALKYIQKTSRFMQACFRKTCDEGAVLVSQRLVDNARCVLLYRYLLLRAYRRSCAAAVVGYALAYRAVRAEFWSWHDILWAGITEFRAFAAVERPLFASCAIGKCADADLSVVGIDYLERPALLDAVCRCWVGELRVICAVIGTTERDGADKEYDHDDAECSHVARVELCG